MTNNSSARTANAALITVAPGGADAGGAAAPAAPAALDEPVAPAGSVRRPPMDPGLAAALLGVSGRR